jgi:predicted dinucleotide-binding enzyme
MKIGVLGSGEVAQALASGCLKHGHEVMVGTRDTGKLQDWSKENPKAKLGSFSEAGNFGETLILAVKGSAAAAVLRQVGSGAMSGKTIIDVANPIADEPPTNGVLKLYTNNSESLMESLQREFTSAHFVKAFNQVGSDHMVNPTYKGGLPTMFICGNDAAAKKKVTGLLEQFGWETVDMGKVESARAIEPLCVLWCIPGFLNNQWSHAFKLLR